MRLARPGLQRRESRRKWVGVTHDGRGKTGPPTGEEDAWERSPKAQQDERDDTTSEAYGGAWSGVEFILTHRPEEIADAPAVVVLNCDIVEAVRRAQEVAGDRDVQIISADIARQALEHDLIDELQVFDVPGGQRIYWELVEIYEDSPRSFGRTYRPKRRS
ncbi:dihydrofolate reductase family protein [Streptomyces sp. AC602_WCS936]|uniref:dihydrofolate reductase family protein n=1 Tax=Streptomyces sp. AC602_WCS936 TaxID=2823685 RepID=UPI001C25FB24|nr:hypothetical protein [Streptomyces sp. AC602_WCS936]